MVLSVQTRTDDVLKTVAASPVAVVQQMWSQLYHTVSVPLSCRLIACTPLQPFWAACDVAISDSETAMQLPV